MLDKVKNLNSSGDELMSKSLDSALHCFTKASDQLDEALKTKTYPLIEILWWKITTLGNLGYCHLKRGEYDEADLRCQTALELHESYVAAVGKFHVRWYWIKRNHLLIRLLRNKDPEALLADFEEIDKKISEQADLPDFTFPLLSLLGSFWMSQRKWNKAASRLERAAKLAGGSVDDGDKVLTQCALAMDYLKLGNMKQSFSILTKTFAHFPRWYGSMDEKKRPELFSRLMACISEYYYDMGCNKNNINMLNCSIFYSKLSAEHLAFVRGGQQAQAAFIAREGRIYDHLAKILYKVGRDNEAIEINVIKHQDEFFAYLTRPKTAAFKYNDITYTPEEQSMRNQLILLSSQGKSSYEKLREFMQELPNRLDPSPSSGSYRDINAVKRFLAKPDTDKNSCLIQLITGGGKDILIVSRCGMDPVQAEIPAHKGLKEKAKKFYDLLSVPPGPANTVQNIYPQAEELYNIIFPPEIFGQSPKVDLTKIETLYFALDSDSDLRRLPISALRTPNGKFLIQVYKLAEVPFSVLNLPDSAVTDDDNSRSAFLDEAQILRFADKKTKIQAKYSLNSHRKFLKNIPHCTPYFDTDFTGPNLINAMRTSSAVYVLTHFELGPDIEQSCLWLGNGVSLSLKDFANMLRKVNMKARHIHFAACNSANTGQVDCMAAFMLYYGSSSVTGSLWSDKTTVTEKFYEKFFSASLTDCPAALRSAALQFIDSDPDSDLYCYRHPFFWSGHVVLLK